MKKSVVVGLVAALAAAVVAGLPGVALSGTAKPVERINSLHAAATVFVDTSACSGFAPAGLALSGVRSTRYAEWFDAGSGMNVSKGWAKMDVSTSVAQHTYRVRQRYLFEPSQPREYVFGWGVTVITRDDGASMRGYSAVGWIAERGRDEVSWLGTPTCLSRH